MDSVEDNECMLVEENVEEMREPTDGMEFVNLDEFQRYYHEYGNRKGFPMKIMTTEKDGDGKPMFIQLSCGRAGKQKGDEKNVLGLHASSKCGCQAKITGHILVDGTVLVKRVTLDHNLALSPSKSKFYRKNRSMSSYIKKKLEFNDRAGIRPNKSYSSCVVEVGGHENFPFFQKDCYNYLDKMRKLRLGEGDAMALHNYFQKMQANNADFFYMMDLDDEGRLRNVFWADAWSRAAYKEFGDVVTFDTTYLTNKYEMPFAHFVGVNHHGQSILLGCGLICGETVEEFFWIFQTWLVCMNDNAPSAINDRQRSVHFVVSLNVDDFAIKCNCQLFEFRGILCKHVLKILFEREIHVIPDNYVLRRWKKDVRRAHTKVKIVYSNWGMKPENVRFEKMCNAFYEMAEFAAEDEKKTCQVQEGSL